MVVNSQKELVMSNNIFADMVVLKSHSKINLNKNLNIITKYLYINSLG